MDEDEQRLGARVDFAGARRPDGRTLVGERVRLERLDPAAHGDDLFAAANDGGDPRLWDYLPYGPFPERPAFDDWLREHAALDDPHLLAIVEQRSGAAAGVLALMRTAPERGRIEIGHVWFGGRLQRTPAATEAIFLAAAHAFDDLGHRRLEWKCHDRNARSRAAAERFGFRYEGTFRQDLIVKGRNRDTAWYSILDGEWPAVAAGFRAWLDPANFDADGRQRRGLRELREG
ncbi:GNAT family N-acetyltransferase [Patulibacter defluvii]|uniref:GNAT family N-acetyltransferase n=1 Tax=Patulibacter defluvii TaxID=3095358 RepID=UPI002A75B573|nr:GNAT family protein [Patulibacter sp. DM4]